MQLVVAGTLLMLALPFSLLPPLLLLQEEVRVMGVWFQASLRAHWSEMREV